MSTLVKSTEQQYPATTLIDLLEPVAGALRVMKDETAKQLSGDILKEVTGRLGTLTDRDMKEMSKTLLERLFSTLDSLRQAKDGLSPSVGRESALAAIFGIAVQLIKSAYIQKKLLGLGLIKEMLPKFSKERALAEKSGLSMDWRDPQQLIKAMEEHKLVDIILGENAHAELLRKVEEVFAFLLENGRFEPRYLELLWKCCKEKHEDIMRTCLGLLASLVPRMGYPLIQELFKLVESTAFDSEIMVSFLEKYTLNVLMLIVDREGKFALMGKKAKSESGNYKMYNLDLFWNLQLDGALVPGKIKDQAMGALIGILNKYTFMANTYVMKAAECIRDGQTVIRSVQLLCDIEFADMCVQGRDGRREPYYQLDEMEKTYAIMRNTLRDCEVYHGKVKADLASRAEPPKDLMATDFSTGFVFGKQAKLYIDFFEYYCSKGGIALEKEDLLKLWKCYVEESFCEQHSDILFAALMKEPKSAHYGEKYVLMRDTVARTVFEEILCNPAPAAIARITPMGFVCFKNYMLWVNQRELAPANGKSAYDFSKHNNQQEERFVPENIQGLATLWVVAFQSRVPAIREQARDFLVNFVDKMGAKYRKKRAEVTEKALATALDNVRDLGDLEQVRIALQIIDSVIEKVECLRHEDVGPAYFYPPLLSMQVYTSAKQSTTVNISENMKLSNFRCLLSSIFKIHKSKIVIKSYERRTEFTDEYEYYMTNFKRLADNKFFVEFRKSEVPLKETPRFILANSAIFGRLQALLKSPKEEIVSEVWKLILGLPLNESYKETLKRMAIPDAADPVLCVQDWEKYLEVSPAYDSVSLTYYLYVLNEMTQTQEATEHKQLLDRLIKKGGTAFLLSVFTKKRAAPRTKLNLKSLEYCVKLISLYITPESYSLVFPGPDADSDFWTGIRDIMEWISGKRDSECEAELFAACCQAHYAMLREKEKFVAEVIRKEYIGLLKECLLRNKNAEVQKSTCEFLRELLVEVLAKTKETRGPRKEILSTLMLDFLHTALEQSDNSGPYFDLMASLIEKAEELDYPTLVKGQHIPLLVSQILSRDVREHSTQDVDYCIGGMMEMLRLEMKKSPELRKEVASPLDLARGLLSALFEVEKSGHKCRSEKSRGKAIRLLEVVLECFPPVSETVLRYLSGLHTGGNWRSNKKADWNIRPGLGSRGGNFVGMKNLGATCYMNSTLQQLFMIPGFRKHLIEAPHRNQGNEDNPLFQLQLIFSSLLGSQRAVYSPKAFTQTFKMDGRILNVVEQKDVDEFLTTLLDHVDQELKGSTQSRLVKNAFVLTLANEIICKDCPHRSETTEDAISVILSVKNKRSIYESLNAYVQSDTLEGENAYYCERCDKKVAAYKRQNIKTLPNVLLIILKRFDFNVETMAKVKINDYCEFPQDLDLEEFTQEGQTCKDLTKDLESGRLTQEDLTEDQRRLLQRKLPKYYYQYKLKGIIVHSGHADAGHYYSYIMDREKKDQDSPRWLEFNDAEVRPFDPKDIPDETFGGEEDVYTVWGKKDATREKTRNAYVLIYERTVTLDAELLAKYKSEEREVDPEDVRRKFEQMRVVSDPIQDPVKVPEALRKIIQQDNKKFWLTQYVFHPAYLSFVSDIIANSHVMEDNNYGAANECLSRAVTADSPVDVSQFAATFFLTTALRAENKELVPVLLRYLKDACAKNVRLCMWICRLFCHPEIVQEFLTDCPMDNVRRWVAGLLYSAMKPLYQLEKAAIHKITLMPMNMLSPDFFAREVGLSEKLGKIPVGKPIEVRDEEHKIPYTLFMMNTFIKQISSTSEHSFGQFFQVFCYFARLGPEARRFLNVCMTMGVALELLFEEKSKCVNIAENHIVRIELKTPVPIGVMTKEHVYISKKAILTKKPLQHIFLFELVYRLINSATIPKLNKAPSKEAESMKSKFNENEERYILALKEPKTLDLLMQSCQESKASLTFLSKTLASLAFDNQDFTLALLKYVIGKMGVEECDKLRLYFRMLHFLLLNKDRLPKKAQVVAENLLNEFKHSTSCFRVSECFIDFLIKMCRNNEIFLGTLRQDNFPQGPQLLDLMERWVKEYPTLGYDFPVPACIISRQIGNDIQNEAGTEVDARVRGCHGEKIQAAVGCAEDCAAHIEEAERQA